MSKRKKFLKVMSEKELQAALIALMAWFESQGLRTTEAARLSAVACGIFAAANGKGSLKILTETMNLTHAICADEDEKV